MILNIYCFHKFINYIYTEIQTFSTTGLPLICVMKTYLFKKEKYCYIYY